MSDSIEFMIQDRRLLASSFSRLWRKQQYTDALQFLIDSNDMISISTICQSILQSPSDLLEMLFNDYEICILFCQIIHILIQQPTELNQNIIIILLKYLVTKSTSSSSENTSFLYKAFYNQLSSIVEECKCTLCQNEQAMSFLNSISPFSTSF